MIPRLLCKLFGCRWSKNKQSVSSIISEAKADPDFQVTLKKMIEENEAMIEKFSSSDETVIQFENLDGTIDVVPLSRFPLNIIAPYFERPFETKNGFSSRRYKTVEIRPGTRNSIKTVRAVEMLEKI